MRTSLALEIKGKKLV